MTALVASDVRLLAGRRQRRITSVVPVAAALLTAAACLVLRATGNGAAPVLSGPALLAVAFVLGVPHGALDTDFLPPSGALLRPARLAAMSAYAAAAVVTFLVWTRWPAPTIGALLVVSTCHFAAADCAFARERRPDRPRAAALRSLVTGAVVVAGPFVCWPARTTELLGRLGVDASAATVIDDVAAIALGVAVAAAVAVTVADVRAGERWPAVEPAAVVLLVWVCPPLVAFAVYFATWHALRQTVRVLARHPATRDGVVPRAVVLRSAAAALVALLGLTGLILAGAVGTGILVALLAVSVPHTVTDYVRDHGRPSARGRSRRRSILIEHGTNWPTRG